MLKMSIQINAGIHQFRKKTTPHIRLGMDPQCMENQEFTTNVSEGGGGVWLTGCPVITKGWSLFLWESATTFPVTSFTPVGQDLNLRPVATYININ